MIGKRPVVMMFLILCLPGCLVGPDYQQPDLNVPEDWNRMILEGASFQLPITVASPGD